MEHRDRFNDEESLKTIHDHCRAIANKHGHLISTRSMMPDHLHIALRGNIEHEPEKIALSFMNNLAFAFGQAAIWRFGYYVGTFGEYDMGCVRS